MRERNQSGAADRDDDLTAAAHAGPEQAACSSVVISHAIGRFGRSFGNLT
jgi:hypothetical protein